MKLLRLAAWTVWFMLGWTALAHAGPLVAAVGAIAGILKAGGIAATLIKLAAGLALQIGASLLQKAMAKKQAQPGISGQLQVGGNNSFSFILGTYATAGSLDYVDTFSGAGNTPNGALVQVITVSDLPQSGLSSRIFINNEEHEIDWEAPPHERGYPVKGFRQNGTDYMWVHFLDGSQTTANPYLLDKFGFNGDRPWTADMIGYGSSIVILTTRLNRKLFTAIPIGRYEPGALPLYDPRKDTSVGGSGSHRWGQQETYEPTSNPAVLIYNILRGIHDKDGNWIWGGKVPGTRLPLASWFAAMNECDVPIDLEDGGTEPQFTAGYEVKVAEHEPADVIDELLKSCNGKIAETGGIYKVHVGAPALPVMFLTDEDFIVTDPQELDPFKGLEATFNGATANYPDPRAAWEMKDAPQRLFPDYEEQDDGRQLLADFQFNAVSSPTQVQRLMTAMVHDGRRMRSHRGTLPPFAFVLEPLDTFEWTSARNGYIDKLHEVSSKDEMTNVNQSVAFVECDPSDFDWNPPTDELPHPVGPIDPKFPPPMVMAGWAVAPAELKDASGTGRRPSIQVSYDGDLDDVRAVRIKVREDFGDNRIVFDGEQPYGSPVDAAGNPIATKSVILNGTFLPDEDYEVQGEFLRFSGDDSEPSAWLKVKTFNIKLAPGLDFDPYEGLVGFEDLEDDLAGYQEWAGGNIREIERRLEEFELWIADQDFGNEYDRQQIRQQLTATYENAEAKWTQQIDVIAGQNAAFAGRIEALEVSVTNQAGQIAAFASAISSLETRVTTVDGQLVSMADAITALSAGSGGDVNTANFRMQVVSGPAGYSRIGAQTRQGGTGTWRGAAWFLDTPNNAALPTRFVVEADQFIVVAGGNLSNVFAVDGTAVRMNVANIGSVTAGSLNINNRFIVASDGATTIRSAVSGARLELNGDRILVVDNT